MLEGLGGKSTPAIGFAMGLERILLALGEQEIVEPPLVFIAPMGTEAQLKGLTIAASLRAAGLHVELDGRGNSLKSMLRRANSMTARFALVIGKTEVEKQEYQLKDLQERESTLLPESDLGAHIISQLSLPSEKVGA